MEQLSPEAGISGVNGHLWEQLVLPLRAKDGILFSPANTGPISKHRQIVTIHDLAVLDHPEWFSRKFSLWYAVVLKQLIRRCIHVITVSEFTKQRILDIDKSCVDKITCIPNGVSAEFSVQTSKEVSHTLDALRIPTDRYVLALGSIEPRKNISTLLRAWALISNDIPNDVWLVVAGGRGPSSIFAESNLNLSADRVHYTGYIGDEFLPSLYSGATALVYPSLYEGFGLPPLEAMACGAPVIIGKGTAMEEFVDDAGILVNPLDPKDIATAIVKLLSNRDFRCDLSTRSVQVARKYNWAETARITESIIVGLQ